MHRSYLNSLWKCSLFNENWQYPLVSERNSALSSIVWVKSALCIWSLILFVHQVITPCHSSLYYSLICFQTLHPFHPSIDIHRIDQRMFLLLILFSSPFIVSAADQLIFVQTVSRMMELDKARFRNFFFFFFLIKAKLDKNSGSALPLNFQNQF